jgi:hypothetical protein
MKRQHIVRALAILFLHAGHTVCMNAPDRKMRVGDEILIVEKEGEKGPVSLHMQKKKHLDEL